MNLFDRDFLKLMRSIWRLIIPVLLMLALLMPAIALAQAPMHRLDDADRFQTANLSPAEKDQILDRVAATSFDTPDSWEAELRVRRVALGDREGLIIQGTRLLCGATGNCQTWLFWRLRGHWLALFEPQAPLAAGFRFTSHVSDGMHDFETVTDAGGGRDLYTRFVFDGAHYQASKCYGVSASGGASQRAMKFVSCK